MGGRGPTVAAIGIAGLVLVAVAFGSRLATPPLVTSVPTSPPLPPATPTPPPEEAAASATPQPVAEAFGDDGTWEVVVQTLITIGAIAAAIVLVVLIVRVARRIAAQERVTPIDEVTDDPVVDDAEVRDVLQAAREQIGVDEDANRVVVRCWEALEAIAADAGVAREPAATATEYVVDMLSRLDLPAEPARRLSRLYAAALFSHERLPQAAVEEARDCLDRLDGALARRRALR